MSDLCSIDEALRVLKDDLIEKPARISAHSGTPFAILRYSPTEEFLFRRKIRLLANELKQNHQISSRFISLSRFVWRSVSETDGLEYLFKTEASYGVMDAQQDLWNRLKPSGPLPLAHQVLEYLDSIEPKPDVVFLVRAGGLSPHIYRSSSLLGDLAEMGFATPTLLCYPGSSVAGADLRFYDLPSDGGLGTYNYRMKIYGAR